MLQKTIVLKRVGNTTPTAISPSRSQTPSLITELSESSSEVDEKAKTRCQNAPKINFAKISEHRTGEDSSSGSVSIVTNTNDIDMGSSV